MEPLERDVSEYGQVAHVAVNEGCLLCGGIWEHYEMVVKQAVTISSSVLMFFSLHLVFRL